MKLVIAPDSFKEAAPAEAVAEAVARGWAAVWPDTELVLVPMADGGEGTLEALAGGGRGELVELEVTGPMGEPVLACFGLLDGGGTAVIEAAQANGLHLVPEARRDPSRATTRGVGELIRAALDRGARRLIIGVGGSATNDGGLGMARALGVTLCGAEGRELPDGGGALGELYRVDCAGLDTRLAQTELWVACDVDNPLCGPSGASLVYGPQKGADPAMAARLDRALARFAAVVERDTGIVLRDLPGAGAAGGLAAGLVAFCGARLTPGVELVAREAGLEGHVRGADLVITGEGSLDGQSLRGKVPVGVARIAARHGVPVIALAGCIAGSLDGLYAEGVTAAFALAEGPMTREESMRDTLALAERKAAMLARLWRAAGVSTFFGVIECPKRDGDIQPTQRRRPE